MRSKVAIGSTEGFARGLGVARAPKISQHEIWGARATTPVIRFSEPFFLGFLTHCFHTSFLIASWRRSHTQQKDD